MALDINNIKPAIEKAKNVATEQYVDTSVANIDISNTLNTNNDVFAQRLGYIDYADMVAAATNGQTIINGGYLRGELIEANSINAGQIDAYAITGKQITGGTITGAQIIGSVIKGSYIDLTTSLALTNWQSLVATKLVVSSWSYVGTTVTINTVVNHGLTVGGIVKLDGLVAGANAPGGYFVVASIVDLNTFTIVAKIEPSGTASVTGNSYVEKYSIPIESTTITSWSYSGSVITCTVGGGLIHGSNHIKKGNTVIISGLTSTTNIPNGEFVITEISDVNNTFKFSVVNIPTGTPSVSGSSKVTSTYDRNFAHHNDGNMVVDTLGYVRLTGQQNFMVAPLISSGVINGDSVKELNLIYDLYSWDNYYLDTLQRGIRQDTSFTSTSELVFSAEGGFATNSKSYEAYFYLIFLDKSIIIHVGSFGSNAHTSAHTDITFDGTLVASAVGSLGVDLTEPWDSGWVDYSTTIKGIPVSIKTTITSGAYITMEFKAVMSSLNPIIGHSIGDLIRINKIVQGGNTAPEYKTLNYNVNFPSIWVQ